MDAVINLKRDIVSACRILSHKRLVEGFGHVSARIPGTETFFMTPRVGLALVEQDDLLLMNTRCEVLEGRQAAPFEAWLHAALMKLQPRIQAITRIHARMANIFSVTERRLEPVHNHGSFFMGGVPVFRTPDLVATEELGNAVARTLGDHPAVLLRGNGQVTVGRSIAEAVMMALYLEESAEVLYGAIQIGTPIPLTDNESKQRQLEALPPVDMERAWNFFKHAVERGAL